MSVNAIACAPTQVNTSLIESRGWTEYMGSPGRAPSADQALPSEPTLQWQKGTGRAAAGAVALGDSVIVIQASDQNLEMISRSDGKRRWRARLSGPGASGPLLTQERVYAGTGGREGTIHSLHLSNGRKEWSRRVGPVSGPLAVFGTQIFGATERGVVLGLSKERGEIVWRRTLGEPVRNGVTWLSGRLFIATDDSLYLIAPSDGRVMVAVAAPGPTLSPPAISGDTLVMVSPEGWMVAISAGALTPLWRVELGGPAFGNPAIARDTVFAVTIGGRLWRVPLATPTEGRATDLGVAVRAPAAPIRSGVLVGTVGGEVLYFGQDTPIPQWKVRVEGPIEQPPLVDRGSLVVVDGRGKIHVWR